MKQRLILLIFLPQLIFHKLYKPKTMSNKTEALKRLTALEGEAKQLRKIIESDKPGKITDRIKTVDDALQETGETVGNIIPFSIATTDEQKALNAVAKLFVIARALNEGWQPDWTDSSEYKYYPYFTKKSGFGFSYSNCDLWLTNTTVGSRLCFKSRDLAEYAGRQFESIYQEFLGK